MSHSSHYIQQLNTKSPVAHSSTSDCITNRHFASHHSALSHIAPQRNTIPHRISPRCAPPRRAALRHAASITSRHGTARHITPRHVSSRHVMLHQTILYRTTSHGIAAQRCFTYAFASVKPVSQTAHSSTSARFDCAVLPSYGMTECMPVSSPPVGFREPAPTTSGRPSRGESGTSKDFGRFVIEHSQKHIQVRQSRRYPFAKYTVSFFVYRLSSGATRACSTALCIPVLVRPSNLLLTRARRA